MTDGPPLAAAGPQLDHSDRLRLESLRYAVNDESATYIAIMRIVTGGISGLLSDLSAAEVAERLADQGIELGLDTVEERLSYLVERGNLARSPRETEARSIREYLTTRARYQLTHRGEIVHRHVEELLGATETAREVSSEMLGAIQVGLVHLAAYDDAKLAATAPDQVARQVTTLFAQFERLVDSTRDFYAYLREVLRRFDLDREQFRAYKAALLDYLDRFVDEIALHMPQIAEAIAAVEPRIEPIVARANDGQRLVGVDGQRARRDRGLDTADWRGLTAWFIGRPGRTSDAAQVRALATEAMGALLTNLRRIVASDSREVSRYRDLVTLARWFDRTDDETAHALWAAAFGLFPARHLGYPADHNGDQLPATTSWWRAPVAEVPMTLRAYGDRAMRGRPGRRADFTDAKARRLAERAAAEARRAAALDELAGHLGPLGTVRISDEARIALLDLYARALAAAGGPKQVSGTSATADSSLRVTVRQTPEESTVIVSPQGRLELCDLTLDLDLPAADAQEETA